MTASQHTENATALAAVVVINWLLAHLANDWVMPAEVANALQSLVIVLLGTLLRPAAASPGAPAAPAASPGPATPQSPPAPSAPAAAPPPAA